ncbi:uncharacterized protein AB675_1517 [Cyphellophora attinorum]|uniref:Uncharacterized protein n=1 Tax=Cyphellophora attinorum TaxID=1664694 RepID=A0A0N1NZE3_9EURO|nr:uncharacterized protein AB675_1517 [Phialophora attinorum]KPI37225.1 hypothetical protein AB675_1517 [Phialophora attinorum]
MPAARLDLRSAKEVEWVLPYAAEITSDDLQRDKANEFRLSVAISNISRHVGRLVGSGELDASDLAASECLSAIARKIAVNVTGSDDGDDMYAWLFGEPGAVPMVAEHAIRAFRFVIENTQHYRTTVVGAANLGRWLSLRQVFWLLTLK